MWQAEGGLDANFDFRRRLLEQMRDPLLIAIEREFKQALARQKVTLSRAEYRRLKWDIVKAILDGEA